MSTTPIVDYSAYLAYVVEHHELEARDASERRVLKRKADVALGVNGETVRAREAVRGDVELKTLLKTLDAFDLERTMSQRQFHQSFVGASLQSIYGAADFERFRSRILAENGLDNARTEILVCTPRRFGKTTSVAMFCAAMLYSVTDAWISVFSTGQRASGMLGQNAGDLTTTEMRALTILEAEPNISGNKLGDRLGVSQRHGRVLRSKLAPVVAERMGA
jgi:hypothetical protein